MRLLFEKEKKIDNYFFISGSPVICGFEYRFSSGVLWAFQFCNSPKISLKKKKSLLTWQTSECYRGFHVGPRQIINIPGQIYRTPDVFINSNSGLKKYTSIYKDNNIITRSMVAQFEIISKDTFL